MHFDERRCHGHCPKMHIFPHCKAVVISLHNAFHKPTEKIRLTEKYIKTTVTDIPPLTQHIEVYYTKKRCRAQPLDTAISIYLTRIA